MEVETSQSSKKDEINLEPAITGGDSPLLNLKCLEESTSALSSH
jgi:hypothetical protein